VIFVDTNVILDLVSDSPWGEWSQRALETAALQGRLAIDAMVYGELSVRFTRAEDVDSLLARLDLLMRATPRAALFLAAKAFQSYRAQGGARTSVLPDFLIGAHAAIEGAPLITRDSRRYRRYFPKLVLIAPP
jgi:hypothetical protein